MSLSQVQNYMQPFSSKNQGYFLHTLLQWHDIAHITYCGSKVYMIGGFIKDEYHSWVQYKSGPGGGPSM